MTENPYNQPIKDFCSELLKTQPHTTTDQDMLLLMESLISVSMCLGAIMSVYTQDPDFGKDFYKDGMGEAYEAFLKEQREDLQETFLTNLQEETQKGTFNHDNTKK